MSSLFNSTLNLLVNYPTSPITLAYSGGVDSQVLLHVLADLLRQKKITNTVKLCHVHHGLSNNADQWAEFAKQQAAIHGFTCQIIHVKLDINSTESLEEQARNARYQALLSITEPSGLILTGHHSDDQTETFLLALKRGAGVKGLSSMQQISVREKRIILRSFLSIERFEIEQYAKAHGLDWVEDESNQNTRFDRNFIRQEIIPRLKQRWPSINMTVNRSAAHCFESQILLDELAQMDLKLAQQNKYQLSIEALKSLSMARFNNLVRFFLISHQCELPSKAQLDELRLQLYAEQDKTPTIKCGKNWFRRYQSQLYLTPEFADISQWSASIVNNRETVITLPDGLGRLSFFNRGVLAGQQSDDIQLICAPTADQTMTIRFIHSNPTCHPDFRQHSRPLKKILQELGLPPWQRKRVPFLYYNEQLVAAIGHFVNREFLPDDNEGTSDNILAVTWEQSNLNHLKV